MGGRDPGVLTEQNFPPQEAWEAQSLSACESARIECSSLAAAADWPAGTGSKAPASVVPGTSGGTSAPSLPGRWWGLGGTSAPF